MHHNFIIIVRKKYSIHCPVQEKFANVKLKLPILTASDIVVVLVVVLIYYPKEITETKSIGSTPKASLVRVCYQQKRPKNRRKKNKNKKITS